MLFKILKFITSLLEIPRILNEEILRDMLTLFKRYGGLTRK